VIGGVGAFGTTADKNEEEQAGCPGAKDHCKGRRGNTRDAASSQRVSDAGADGDVLGPRGGGRRNIVPVATDESARGLEAVGEKRLEVRFDFFARDGRDLDLLKTGLFQEPV